MRVERARYFLAAIEAGSMRAAAQRCGISQAAIGQQVALLEEDLNVVLLTRGRGGVRPTPAGQALLEPLARLAAAEDALYRVAAHTSGAYHGVVAIGANALVSEAVVAPVVGRLSEHHPALTFTVMEGPSADIEAGVLAGDLDFGVIAIPGEAAVHGLQRTPLLAAPVGVLLRLDHPLADRQALEWKDLETWPIVTLRSGSVLWDRLQQGLPQAKVVVQAMSARSVQVMVVHGAGAGVLAAFHMSGDLPDVTWIPVLDAAPLEVGVVQRRDSLPSPSALVVRRLIYERAPELLQALVPQGDA